MATPDIALPGEARRIVWDRGSAEVWALGATLHHVALKLDDGREVRPFAEAPWHGDAGTTGDAAIPAHLRYLGGEWPCVPFGRSAADPVVHGFGTDNCWQFLEADGRSAALAIDYPDDRPIARIERTVRAIAGEAALECTLTVVPRRDCTIPVGLHPIVRLPSTGDDIIVRGACSHGETFPVVFEPGISTLAAAARFGSLDELPLAGGSTTTLSRIASTVTEEAFQLFGVDGRLQVEWPGEGFALALDWDPVAFPTCLFWLSAGGRTNPPWSGRFRGLGVEPLAARFRERDGQGVIEGGIAFRAGERWTTTYRIAAKAL